MNFGPELQKQIENNSGGSVTKLSQRNVAGDDENFVSDTKIVSDSESKGEKVLEFDNQAEPSAIEERELKEYERIPKVKPERNGAKKKQVSQSKSVEI